MSYSPYARFSEEEFILRDHLAMDRTILANERTLLSYIRTALAFVATGVAFVQFFDAVAMQAIGWIFIPVGMVTLMAGLMSYRKMQSLIREVRESPRTKS